LRRVYLDNNATTPLLPEVVEAMLPCYNEHFGNASSIHWYGRECRKAVEEARDRVAALLGAEPSEIVFTSGGSESDNMAIKGTAYKNADKGRHIITSEVEHHAVLDTCKFLGKNGFEITYLPVDKYGMVDPQALRDSIREDTILVTIMHANNEIGTVQPLSELGAIAREKGVTFHSDAVQSVGKIDTRVDELNVDLLTFSAHKLHGPKGVGGLYIRKKTKLTPLLHGGHQENNRRAGTENVAGIVGMGKAFELAAVDMEAKNGYIRSLRDKLQDAIMDAIPEVQLNGHPEKRIPNTVNISFKFVEGESLLINLDLKGVAISTGSACTSGSLEPSHVLQAMGIPHEIIHGSLRFSFSSLNTVEDVEYTMEVLPGIVEKVRAMSPLWEG
jgi:cysteine desulfurase